MRAPLVLLGFAVLLPIAACRDKSTPSSTGPSTGQEIASAMALASVMTQDAGPQVTGKIHSVGGDLGTWDTALGDCQSGEVNGFFGADFYVSGTTALRLRYVHDEAKGDIVKVAFPSKAGSVEVFDKSRCTVLEGSVQKTNYSQWTPKGTIRHVMGHVKFDCTSDGKGHVTGDATFEHCH